ncbi:MAG: hypothetical protein E7479_03315 [Ruminococcaceae bacterium]|nr:hypothetical protein [Oscillospiraceae bacterium]
MNIVTAIETMRTIVDAYDKFEAKKLKIKRKTEKVLKGGKNMKFGTIIGIVVGALALIAAGAAAAYLIAKKKGCHCEDCCDCCCDDDLFDEFPEEEICCDCETVEEVPAEEDLKF